MSVRRHAHTPGPGEGQRGARQALRAGQKQRACMSRHAHFLLAHFLRAWNRAGRRPRSRAAPPAGGNDIANTPRAPFCGHVLAKGRRLWPRRCTATAQSARIDWQMGRRMRASVHECLVRAHGKRRLPRAVRLGGRNGCLQMQGQRTKHWHQAGEIHEGGAWQQGANDGARGPPGFSGIDVGKSASGGSSESFQGGPGASVRALADSANRQPPGGPARAAPWLPAPGGRRARA